jgi:hypothetical protein
VIDSTTTKRKTFLPVSCLINDELVDKNRQEIDTESEVSGVSGEVNRRENAQCVNRHPPLFLKKNELPFRLIKKKRVAWLINENRA